MFLRWRMVQHTRSCWLSVALLQKNLRCSKKTGHGGGGATLDLYFLLPRRVRRERNSDPDAGWTKLLHNVRVKVNLPDDAKHYVCCMVCICSRQLRCCSCCCACAFPISTSLLLLLLLSARFSTLSHNTHSICFCIASNSPTNKQASKSQQILIHHEL